MSTTQHDAISNLLDDAAARLIAHADELTSPEARVKTTGAAIALQNARKRLREALSIQRMDDADAL